MKPKKKVIIYADGACSGNPGKGGWGAVLFYADKRLELSGFEAKATNNQMELLAAIKALEALKEPCEVDLFSDSAYLVNAFAQGWIDGWRKNGWKTAAKKPVLNQDLWKRLIELCAIHQVRFHKVKGHSDNEHNNRCDFLATEAIRAGASSAS